MYRAKDPGGARHELFNEPMRDRVMHRLRTERALGRALENDELRLHYQPIVSLEGRQTEGRRHSCDGRTPERLRSPADFILIAEESGLILRLGACGCSRRPVARPPDGADLRAQDLLPVNVNLAARQLADERLPELVRSAVERAGLESWATSPSRSPRAP
ncbi:MAG: EAL domain-containing protein [Thermoleophilaceae bacterium]